MGSIQFTMKAKMLNHKPTKFTCEHCGDPIPDSLIMVDSFYKYNSLACANCTDYDVLNEDPLEYEEDYDQPYDD